MKDEIIRSLVARLGAAEAAVEAVVETKDEIIRGLGQKLSAEAAMAPVAATTVGRDRPIGAPQAAATELQFAKRDSRNTLRDPDMGGESHLFGDTRSELSAARSLLEARELELLHAQAELRGAFVDEIDEATSAARALEAATTVAALAAAAPMPPGVLAELADYEGRCRFTVLPVDANGDDSYYYALQGDILDQRIGSFSNGRICKVLFTRVDAEGVYLFGRLPVRCRLSDDCADGVAVTLLTGSTDDERAEVPMSTFVERWEELEHSYFETLLFSPESALVG